MTTSEGANEYLANFANAVREMFLPLLVGQTEGRLKNPVGNQVRALGTQPGHTLNDVLKTVTKPNI